jgi:hypothetical protein
LRFIIIHLGSILPGKLKIEPNKGAKQHSLQVMARIGSHREFVNIRQPTELLKEEDPMKCFLLCVALIAFAPYAGALAQTPDPATPAGAASPSPVVTPPAGVPQTPPAAGKHARSSKSHHAAEPDPFNPKKSKKDLDEERKMDHDMHICIGC